MSKRTVLSVPIVALAMAAGTAFAQTPEAPKSAEPSKFYKLDFVVKEVEGGKVVNSRSYSAVASDGQNRTVIRAGAKIAVVDNKGTSYIDVGVNIDCLSIRELHGSASLYVSAEVSSVPDSSSQPPTIRQNKWSSAITLPLRKPSVVFSSDDPTSKRQVQLELTVTPVTYQ